MQVIDKIPGKKYCQVYNYIKIIKSTKQSSFQIIFKGQGIQFTAI